MQACEDPKLFKPFFKNPESWQAWFVFLTAIFNLPMNRQQRRIFQACTGRNKVTEAKEAWLVVGRRGGKSFIAALIAVFLACFRDYRPYITHGEKAVVMILASDRRQSKVIFNYVRALLTNTPMLSKLIKKETAEGIELTNNVVIEIHTSNFRAVRGYTVVAAICDEIAFWRSEDSANPDKEIITALRPAMLTIPNSLLIALSSPYAQRGELHNNYKLHFGKDDSSTLVWQAPSLIMNPSLPKKLIDAAYEADPAMASAEYGAEFRRDIEAFITMEAVESRIIQGRFELSPVANIDYRAFTDPSGGSQDSFTLGISHNENGVVILDCLRERKPPFSPEGVVREFAELLKTYRVQRVSGDRYAGEWPREQFQKYGIAYEPSELSKSELYQEALPLLNAGKVELLDNKTLTNQLVGLERRTSRNGKDSIDHCPGGRDDVSNSVAGAIYLCKSGVPVDFEAGTFLLPSAGVTTGLWQLRHGEDVDFGEVNRMSWD